MQKKLLFLVTVLCLVITAITCHAGDKNKTKKKMTPTTLIKKNMGQDCFLPSDSVKAHLGTMASEVIFNPTKVVVYRVEGRDSIREGEVEVEKNFVRTKMVGTLSKDCVRLVQYLLITDSDNYGIDSMRVRSPYVPDIELQFIRKNEVVSVLVSRSDFTWTLISDGKKQFNYNYAEKKAINRLFNQIIKD